MTLKSNYYYYYRYAKATHRWVGGRRGVLRGGDVE